MDVRKHRSRQETSPKDLCGKEAVLALPFAQGAFIGETGCSGGTGKGGCLRMIWIEPDAMADQHSGHLPRIHRLGDAIQQCLVFRRTLSLTPPLRHHRHPQAPEPLS
jgi:hypothetical protein